MTEDVIINGSRSPRLEGESDIPEIVAIGRIGPSVALLLRTARVVLVGEWGDGEEI